MMLAGQPVPVHEDAPSEFNPIHEDDIVAQVPKLLGVASVPATVVNWFDTSGSAPGKFGTLTLPRKYGKNL